VWEGICSKHLAISLGLGGLLLDFPKAISLNCVTPGSSTTDQQFIDSSCAREGHLIAEVDPAGMNCQGIDSIDGAIEALQHVILKFQGDIWKAACNLELRHYQHNSFCMTQPVCGTCEVAYDGPHTEDVLVRVYMLDAKHHQWDAWNMYEFHGYLHAMRQCDNLKLRAAGAYFLGFVIHRGLNIEWFWKLSPADMGRHLRRSAGGRWTSRMEVLAETDAYSADFFDFLDH